MNSVYDHNHYAKVSTKRPGYFLSLISCPFFLSIIWKSDLFDKIKQDFFRAVLMSILLYECTIWTLTKCIEKKLDGDYTRILKAISNKPCKQHPTKQQLYDYLPPISNSIRVRRTKHVEHWWRSKNELISDILLWIRTYEQALSVQQELIYISFVATQDVVWKTCQ